MLHAKFCEIKNFNVLSGAYHLTVATQLQQTLQIYAKEEVDGLGVMSVESCKFPICLVVRGCQDFVSMDISEPWTLALY